MFDSLGVKVPWPSWWRGRAREGQGRGREAGSERSVDQKREPMNKNRMRRSRVWGELAKDSEAHVQQAQRWQIRQLRVEGGRTYRGRPVARHGMVTEDGAALVNKVVFEGIKRQSRSGIGTWH
jgi:hypothetical protein